MQRQTLGSARRVLTARSARARPGRRTEGRLRHSSSIAVRRPAGGRAGCHWKPIRLPSQQASLDGISTQQSDIQVRPSCCKRTATRDRPIYKPSVTAQRQKTQLKNAQQPVPMHHCRYQIGIQWPSNDAMDTSCEKRRIRDPREHLLHGNLSSVSSGKLFHRIFSAEITRQQNAEEAGNGMCDRPQIFKLQSGDIACILNANMWMPLYKRNAYIQK